VAPVVIVIPALIVRLNVAVVEFEAESVTLTVKLGVPVAFGVPERTPAADKLKLTAARLLAPEVTVHVYPVPDPPVAASVCAYAVPTMPAGRVAPVVMLIPLAIVIEIEPVAVSDPESVTLTEKFCGPGVVGVPEITPPVERLKPPGSVDPLANVHVYPVPVPPVADSACEYAVPT
jgi:hypothetical protein